MSIENELFVRCEKNPILTAQGWPYGVSAVFNPAAVKHNGETFLLARTENKIGFSHLSLAKSKDGLTDWEIDPKPTLKADAFFFEGEKGLEDPRVVWVKELQKYIIACVSFREEYPDTPCGISLIGTKDFSEYERISKPLDPENKNSCLFPKKFGDLFALIHRPVVENRAYIAVSFSPDLVFWGKEKPLLSTRAWHWDSEKVGLACPPIETKEGWLIIYHGSTGKANKLIYRVGLALLNLENLKVIRRSKKWLLGPERDYEGWEDGIVFPCGYTLNEETNELRVYYGTNDSKIGVAISNLEEILEYLMQCPDC
jgi:beta-1,4-mannooligosaccharide/beta-1,4-mannosyl-N-acetylglucosamine phosphorylase